MFGYIRIVEDELRVRDWKNYKNFYCGLCKQIANYSQFARLMLSYDMVFFALLIEADPPSEVKMCKHKFFRRCKKSCGDERMNYIAAISVMLLYYKIQNDYYDGEKKKKYLLYILESGHKKACRDYPIIADKVSTAMNNLYELEKSNCSDFQNLENCFAKVFSDFYDSSQCGDEYKEIRGKIAYHVAAWVYWLDMYIDIDEDRESGDFNAILLQKDIEVGKAWVKKRMLEHIESAETLLNILPFNDNTSIAYNIISVGMPMQMQKNHIITIKTEKTDEMP